jgi:hypothetical protein
MVFAVFVYVLIATVLAVKIGRPLVRLNFLNEQYNANYRYLLVRLLEYAESIAFYAGEKVEGMLLRSRFGQIIHNNWRIVFRSLKFQGFNLIVSQTAVVFPLIVQAHRFFSKQITLGDLMQTSQALAPCTTICPSSAMPTTTLPVIARCSTVCPVIATPCRKPPPCHARPSAIRASGWRCKPSACTARLATACWTMSPGNSGRQRAADSRPFRLGQNHAAAQPGRAVAL